MPVTKITDGLDLTVTSVVQLPSNDGDLRNLLDALFALHSAAPLTKFDVDRDPLDLALYDYRFEAADGRKWKQTLRIPAGSEAVMTFDVADGWKESEFALHRPVRSASISLARNFQVQEVKCRW